jgi:DNA polymerase-3 subunit delta'
MQDEQNWGMIGHEWAVTLLRRRLAAGRIAHAYLFAGLPGVGKTRLAIKLAQALNCEAVDPPCGQCPACTRISAGAHPDVRLIRGEGAGGSLKIDQIRDLQREAVLAPYAGRYRVYCLRRTDLASIEAANSLLKTLEEPPGHVVLVLTAVSVESLPPTVVSRCQRLDLRPAPLYQVEAALRRRGVVAEEARLLARLSGGRVGWALNACQDRTVMDRRNTALDEMGRLLAAGRVERLAFAAEASRDVAACRDLLEQWAGWWRDLLLVSAGLDAGRAATNIDREKELGPWARVVDVTEARRILAALITTVEQLDANVNPRLALEGLLLKLPLAA